MTVVERVLGIRDWAWWRDVVVMGFAINIAGAAAWPVLRRTFSRNAHSLAERWRDLRINRMAWRVNRLERVRRTPAVALADILMAALVVMLGGGYAMTILLMAIYSRVAAPASHPDIISFLGGVALAMAGFYRASAAHSDLLQTERKLATLKKRLRPGAGIWKTPARLCSNRAYIVGR